ncbi:MAG: hypothetical protein WCI23_11865, partial [Chlorobiaceae bacterium]
KFGQRLLVCPRDVGFTVKLRQTDLDAPIEGTAYLGLTYPGFFLQPPGSVSRRKSGGDKKFQLASKQCILFVDFPPLPCLESALLV